MNMNTDQALENKIQEIEKSIPEPRTPISFEELERRVNRWLLIQDKSLLKVILGAVVANKLEGDPVWMFIVAAPGGTKTELIRGLAKIEGIYSISDLTPQTFLSGERGKTGSLLLRLPYGTILTYKDFTTVLSMHRDKQQAIISQLREIFDGYYRKEFGTGETKTWEGKLGFIAGVTSVIDRHYEIYSVLGERFIQYRPIQAKDVDMAIRAIKNSGQEKAMREDIQNATADFLSSIHLPTEKVALPDDLQERIAYMAALCVRARSGVIRDGYSTREIELIPEAELPTRLAKQLITLLIAVSLIDGQPPESNYELIWKVAMDSVPQKRRRVLEMLITADRKLETAEVATKIGYPTNTTRRVLEDLHGLKLADREHEGQGHADKWQISEHARELLDRALPPTLRDTLTKLNIPESLPETSDDLLAEAEALFEAPIQDTLPEMSDN